MLYLLTILLYIGLLHSTQLIICCILSFSSDKHPYGNPPILYFSLFYIFLQIKLLLLLLCLSAKCREHDEITKQDYSVKLNVVVLRLSSSSSSKCCKNVELIYSRDKIGDVISECLKTKDYFSLLWGIISDVSQCVR